MFRGGLVLDIGYVAHFNSLSKFIRSLRKRNQLGFRSICKKNWAPHSYPFEFCEIEKEPSVILIS